MGGDSFLSLMNHTLEETMIGDGFSQVFINDIVEPITRVNYGQSVRISGFVGMREQRIIQIVKHCVESIFKNIL